MPATQLHIRPACLADLPEMREICIATADAGGDARDKEDAPELLSLVFAEPYVHFEPGVSLVVEDDDGVAGYVLGVPDSVAFDAWAAAEWFPRHRAELPDPGADEASWKRPSDWLRSWIHRPRPSPAALREDWPAHGHIDLLPRMQGKGAGRQLMSALFEALAARGAQGIHLGVQPLNTRALHFYATLGFRPLDVPTDPGTAYVGRQLP
ncbi:GNAT family N-acetyltransferase [Tropicimonas sp. TH_r6]|uniref:GNAT family N-acetyltransferase n=1 Tax=Tropicimonas sp. TH_r6 TaxID=3082085 RepID=UPI002953C2F7|nr:GNAT family N-acetyltransferase [Tropicimonas sp. TH_r6]MDV7145299.1 GNAT family N-acetyltransferase [Tropicimonas sp. TH_r6]